MIFRQLFDFQTWTYTYLIASRKGGEAVIIDPVLDRVERYMQLLDELDLKLVKALDTHFTTTNTIKELKETLNKYSQQTSITVQWIKAHTGYKGNERADELAKLGSLTIPIGPVPHIPLSKATLNGAINHEIHEQWQERWKNRKDARQTAIFFPEIQLSKSRELLKLPKYTL